MRVSSILIIAGTFVAAAVLSLVTAQFAVRLVEENSYYGVTAALNEEELTWAEVSTNGLQVVLKGTAPSEATRFLAVSTAGTVVDAARVIDEMRVEAQDDLAAPRFSVEILRNDDRLSLIGLIPAGADREALLDRLGEISSEDNVADLLETADYDIPDGWGAALDFGLTALEALPRSKISIDAERVEITAMAESDVQKRDVETRLSRRAPGDLRVAFNISSPRPVITPFSLRFILDDAGARFDSCSADSEEARARILSAAADAGLEGKARCPIGLGVPTPSWGEAADMAIEAVGLMGGGSVTFSDADITLVAPQGTAQRRFDSVVGELENTLPEVFALHAVLPPEPETGNEGPAEFVATLSPEGLVQMRGRVNDDMVSKTAESFAKARFAGASVDNSARTDETLPSGWPVRVLAGLEALSYLSNGSVRVTAEDISVSGDTGDKAASAEVTKQLSEKLGATGRFSVDVSYLEKLDPIASLFQPDECEARIAEILDTRQITFEPGSDTVDAESLSTVDEIAETLKNCVDVRMEIAGHTDSQGRESMNQALSKSRAVAVLNALRERRILTAGFTAVGYGESDPIADNDTEEGREANRRIEFELVRPEPVPETETTLESMEASGASDDSEGSAAGEADTGEGQGE
ncbi:hypothetical protein DZK27_03535 [Rhodobacteraceae bacterium 63075]|nr:hypothetical protein DZK27_03535 [Rhodobacteraceae bacterium 63075]